MANRILRELRDLGYKKPTNLKTHEVKSDDNTLVLREPTALDYAEIEDLKRCYKDNPHYMNLAIICLLTESLNGNKNLAPTDIISEIQGDLYSELVELISEFQMKIIPKEYKDMIPSILENAFKDQAFKNMT